MELLKIFQKLSGHFHIELSSIKALWVCLSIVLSAVSLVVLNSATWILQLRDTDNSGFGPLKVCELKVSSDFMSSQRVCQNFILEVGFMNWPNSPVQVTALLYAVGTIFLLVSAALSLISIVKEALCMTATTWLAGYLQLSAVLVQTVGLLIFPIGLNSQFAKDFCGNSARAFHLGHCHLGWGYVFAMINTALLIFLPFLSKFSSKLYVQTLYANFRNSQSDMFA